MNHQQPHIARIDYDNEHRCAEHEHDRSPSVIIRVIPWPTPTRANPILKTFAPFEPSC